eukprot:jgi/Picsp_1/1140/NSC_04621-R1_translation elongation factor p
MRRGVSLLRNILHRTEERLGLCSDVGCREEASTILRGLGRWIHTKKQASDIREGNVIETEDGRVLRVTKFNNSQGNARQLTIIHVEAKDVVSHAKQSLRLKTRDMVNIVRLEEKIQQFLYEEDGILYFMDPKVFEQMSINIDAMGPEDRLLLKEGGEVVVELYSGRPISVKLPPTVVLTVAETAPHIKGATAAPQYKPAVLETGLRLNVPPFISAKDNILVDTQTKQFVKRISQ